MELATTDLDTKRQALDELLRGAGSALIAYSGGVDSAFLAKAAVDALGRDRVLAVTGRSPSYSEAQHQIALEVARSIGLQHEEIETSELDDPDYAANPADRCYYCKTDLFRRLAALAQERRYAAVFDGTNADDMSDHRPGLRAARELGVRSPLQEVGLTKAEIRVLSRAAGLSTWDLPATPCLASRLPYGTRVTPQRLRQVEDAEARLQALHSWRDLRVRYHGDLARIEVPAADLPLFGGTSFRAEVLAVLQAAGFARGCVDLSGYRRGSLNPDVGNSRRPPDVRASEVAGARVLAEAGAGATVEAAGAGGELALVRPCEAPTTETLGLLTDIADELGRRAGFKHVALAL